MERKCCVNWWSFTNFAYEISTFFVEDNELLEYFKIKVRISLLTFKVSRGLRVKVVDY